MYPNDVLALNNSAGLRATRPNAAFREAHCFFAVAEKYGDDAQKRLQLYKAKKPFRTEPIKAK